MIDTLAAQLQVSFACHQISLASMNGSMSCSLQHSRMKSLGLRRRPISRDSDGWPRRTPAADLKAAAIWRPVRFPVSVERAHIRVGEHEPEHIAVVLGAVTTFE
ncbi:hypothetical protein GCM10010464_54640 [Pseudonocardia yunnanensis]